MTRADHDDPPRARGGRATRVTAVVIGIIVVIGIVAVLNVRERADGVGTLDECSWSHPVVILDGEATYLPVMGWPPGVSYDHEQQAVVAASGATLVSRGQSVTVRGSIRDMRGGDIPPCFVTRGIDLESISP